MTPADQTPNAGHAVEEYWQGLGRFIEIFAFAEGASFYYTSQVGGMTDEVARIVCKQWHVGQMLEFVRKVWSVRPPPREFAHLDDALVQFMTINHTRNQIIHHASFVAAEFRRVVSDTYRALPGRMAHEQHVSPTILKQMTLDLIRITLLIVASPARPALGSL